MEKDLPPWKIFTKAISLIWEKRLFALYISFPIILFYMLFGVAIDLGMIETTSPVLDPEEASRGVSFGEVLWALPFGLFFCFLLAVLAVYWHRSILLGEQKIGAIPLRCDRVVWRYLLFVIGVILWAMLLYLSLALVFVALGVLLSTSGVTAKAVGGLAVALIFFPLFIYLGIVIFRLSLTLPAAAIGYKDFGFRAAWQASRGHAWQMLGIILLMFGLSILVALMYGVAILVFGLPNLALFASLPKSLILTVEGVFYAAQTLISIGVLSLSFAYLTYEGPRGGAVARK